MKVMLFGDSHLSAFKTALDQVKLPKGLQMSFWGTPGTRFRNISWTDSCITPDDEQTAASFARFNGDGLTRLDPTNYDAVVFVGARIRPGAILPDLLNHIAHPTRHLTQDYMRLVLAEHFERHSTYQMAKSMANEASSQVLMAMVSLETEGKNRKPRALRAARNATGDDIEMLWALISEILAEDGIAYVPQPLDTIVEGYYTDPKFGVDGDDAVHKKRWVRRGHAGGNPDDSTKQCCQNKILKRSGSRYSSLLRMLLKNQLPVEAA